jgi:hypothetical protein
MTRGFLMPEVMPVGPQAPPISFASLALFEGMKLRGSVPLFAIDITFFRSEISALKTGYIAIESAGIPESAICCFTFGH